MSLFNGKGPLIERPSSPSPVPSPAHEALKGNLEAAGESTLSLRKKRSWIGSLRDAVHKGALHAKAAVDIFRSDQQKNERPTESTETVPIDSEHDASPDHASPPRESLDSMTKSLVSSTTPLHGDNERRNRFMSKVATASPHRHRPSHPSREKRGSVYSMAGRPRSELADIAGPEQFASTSPKDDNGATHLRKHSVVDSIAGSIRGIGRRAGKAMPTRARTIDVEPDLSTEIVPSPSSPIDIPAAAPSLDLDLGPTGFMTPMFGRSPERNQKERVAEIKKLMNPANITTGVPPPTPILASGNLPVHTLQYDPFRPVTPRDLLKIQIDDIGAMATPPGPATPMPGTSFALELDGSNSEASDKLKVFERSVTPSLDQERKELRKMRSLDAMADACAIAHANDEVVELAELLPSTNADSTIGLQKIHTLRPQTPRRENLSSETTQTLHSCPSDMEELARQRTQDNAKQARVIIADAASEISGNSVYEDPFDDCNAVKSGPPSPDRSMELPFRPKVRSDSKVKATVGENGGHESSINVEIVEQSTSEPDPFHDTVDQLQSQSRADTLEATSNENTDPFQTVASDDNSDVRAQELLTSNIVLPNFDDLIFAAVEGPSPHGGPLVPQMYQLVNTDVNTSPRSIRSRTTYTAGLGDTEYKFSFDNWLRESSGAAPPESEPSTPHRRCMDMSLDSVSTSEERKTPQTSPRTTTSDRMPSMGNRLDFELKRSERNTRYNALHQDTLPVLPNVLQSSLRGPPRFIFGASDETDETGVHLADFENAYAGSREATPRKKGEALPARVASDDSVADSLKNAAFDYSQLEEHLADSPHTDHGDIFADPSTGAESDDLPVQVFKAVKTSHDGPSTLAEAPVQLSKDNYDNGSYTQEDADIHFKFTPTFGRTFTPPAQSSPLPTHPRPLTDARVPSLTQSPTTITGRSGSNRVASTDTLDRSLKLFMSSESGYQADESSICQPNSSDSKGKLPVRYRSKGKRSGKPLSEISDNIG